MIRDVYQKCYERQAAFYRTRPRAKKMLTAGNYALTAAVFVAYALLCLIELIVRRKTATQADVIRIVARSFALSFGGVYPAQPHRPQASL